MPNPSLRIGIRVFDEDGWMGGKVYSRNLIYCLARLPNEERPLVRLLGFSGQSQLITEFEDLAFVDQSCLIQPPRATPSLLARLFRRVLRSLKPISVDHEGTDCVFPCMAPVRSRQAPIYWIPDFQVDRYPEFFSAGDRAARRDNNARIAGSEGILILSSHAALSDFQRYYPNARVRPRVWSFCTILTENEINGRNPHEVYQLPSDYLYIPNQFWKHKNHITVFRSLALLRQRGMIVHLVCSGKEGDPRDPEHMAGLHAFLAENDLTDQVRFLGIVPRRDQIEIFRHAKAIVQPSLFEGWSTAIEDAKALGCPIFASDLSVHHEQLNGSPDVWFFKAGDADELAATLQRVTPGLQPGPNAQREAAARRLGEDRQRAVARAFLAVAHEAVEEFNGKRANSCAPR